MTKVLWLLLLVIQLNGVAMEAKYTFTENPKFEIVNKTSLKMTIIIKETKKSSTSLFLRQRQEGSRPKNVHISQVKGVGDEKPIELVAELSPCQNHSDLFLFFQLQKKARARKTETFSYMTQVTCDKNGVPITTRESKLGAWLIDHLWPSVLIGQAALAVLVSLAALGIWYSRRSTQPPGVVREVCQYEVWDTSEDTLAMKYMTASRPRTAEQE